MPLPLSPEQLQAIADSGGKVIPIEETIEIPIERELLETLSAHQQEILQVISACLQELKTALGQEAAAPVVQVVERGLADIQLPEIQLPEINVQVQEAPAHGWRFVVKRDEVGKMNEILALPVRNA